jgi:hypothetical protein
MNDFTKEELHLITFLCMQRKAVIGFDDCENEGTLDLYNHASDLIRNYDEE